MTTPPAHAECPGESPSATAIEDAATALALPTPHGLLRGRIELPPDARGLLLLVRADEAGLADDEGGLAAALRDAGFATLRLELLSEPERRFPDAARNVPQLAQRLLDALGLLRQRMRDGVLPGLPLALHGCGPTVPVAVRVAALRDHDIAALVCRNGLIDLAGTLYLRTLAAPLCLLVDADAAPLLAAGQRALRELSCPAELRSLPAGDAARTASETTIDWLRRHLAPAIPAAGRKPG